MQDIHRVTKTRDAMLFKSSLRLIVNELQFSKIFVVIIDLHLILNEYGADTADLNANITTPPCRMGSRCDGDWRTIDCLTPSR